MIGDTDLESLRSGGEDEQDADDEALYRLVNGMSIAGDSGARELREFVTRHRMHRALDKVLDRVGAKRNCAGDRFRGVRP